MSKRILLILSHSIEEYDQLKLLSGLGYEVFSLGGYINPHEPHDPKRPALPNVPKQDVLHCAVDALGTEDSIGAAAACIPDEILQWLGSDGTIICHHYLERIYGQWDRLVEWGGRVVWRTVGQSTEGNEAQAATFRAAGLEIVRYSPHEIHIPNFAGEDALIRFYKDPDEWMGWHGNGGEIGGPFVGNITQDLQRRTVWCNGEWYLAATAGLRAVPAGPGSEQLPGGVGLLTSEGLKEYLRSARCYVYTGTQPASYTLGLIEALMTGVPVVSIGPGLMTIFPYGPALFEGHELSYFWSEDPGVARSSLEVFLEDQELAGQVGQHLRHRTILEFGIDRVGKDWVKFLGKP